MKTSVNFNLIRFALFQLTFLCALSTFANENTKLTNDFKYYCYTANNSSEIVTVNNTDSKATGDNFVQMLDNTMNQVNSEISMSNQFMSNSEKDFQSFQNAIGLFMSMIVAVVFYSMVYFYRILSA